MGAHQFHDADGAFKTALRDGLVDEMLVAEAQTAALTGVLHPLLTLVFSAHRHAIGKAVCLKPAMVRSHVRKPREAGPPLTHFVVVRVQRAMVATEWRRAIDTGPHGIAATTASQESAA